MSRHNLVSAQTYNVCITCRAAIATICVLGRLVQYYQKGWDRGG